MSIYNKLVKLDAKLKSYSLKKNESIFFVSFIVCGVLASTACAVWYYNGHLLYGFYRAMLYMCVLLAIAALIYPPMALAKSRSRGVCFYLMCATLAAFLLPSPQKMLLKKPASPPTQPHAVETQPQKPLALEKCRKDLLCWGNKHLIIGTRLCQKAIERKVTYDFKWTDTGWTALKFTHYQWLDQQKGTLIFIGDKIKLQNMFGAWQNHIYACHFDPDNDKFLQVNLIKGRL